MSAIIITIILSLKLVKFASCVVPPITGVIYNKHVTISTTGHFMSMVLPLNCFHNHMLLPQ
jgi:hypothetical protein